MEKSNTTYIESFETGVNYSCAQNSFTVAAPPAMNPAELLRKSFVVNGKVSSAMTFVSGVGWVDGVINGTLAVTPGIGR